MVEGIATQQGEQVDGIPNRADRPTLDRLPEPYVQRRRPGVRRRLRADRGTDVSDREEHGAWTGSGSQVFAIGMAEPMINQASMVLSGEDAYDGLAAYVFIKAVDGELAMEAVVLEGVVPPVPEPVAVNAAADVPTLDGIAGLDAYLSDFDRRRQRWRRCARLPRWRDDLECRRSREQRRRSHDPRSRVPDRQHLQIVRRDHGAPTRRRRTRRSRRPARHLPARQRGARPSQDGPRVRDLPWRSSTQRRRPTPMHTGCTKSASAVPVNEAADQALPDVLALPSA